jgi:hypothetical protein
MSEPLLRAAEWVLADDGRWRLCDRREPLSALQRRVHERIVLNTRHIAASRALCKRVHARLRAWRVWWAWHAATAVTIN